MTWTIPRFRVRTLLVVIAIVALGLGAGIWYFTPRLEVRLVLDKTTGTHDEFFGAVAIENRAPRPFALPHQGALLGLDLVVIDSRGNVVTTYPYWHRISPVWPEPRLHVLRWGEVHSEEAHLFGSAPVDLPPGTYTIGAIYANGSMVARSEKVTVRLLPGETYRWESSYDPDHQRNVFRRVKLSGGGPR